MKLYYPLSVIFFIACLLCPEVGFSQNNPVIWQAQLEWGKNHSRQEEGSDLNDLNLITYTYKGIIGSEANKRRIIDSLFSYDAPAVFLLPPIVVTDTLVKGDSCIIQEKDLLKFEIVTIRKLMEMIGVAEDDNPLTQTRQRLNKSIKTDFEYLELEWEYRDRRFKSIGVVSNQHGGFIYEPISFNILSGSHLTITEKISNP